MSLDADTKPFKWGKKLEPKQKIKIYVKDGTEKEPHCTVEVDTIEVGKIWLFDNGYVKVPDQFIRTCSILPVDFWYGDRMVWTCRVIKLFSQ